MKIYCDGSTTKICYVYEGGKPVVIDLMKVVTNNTGEYLAVINALESALRLRYKEIEILTDSELVVKQVNRSYRTKKQHLRTLRSDILTLMRKFDRATLQYVNRENNFAGLVLDEIGGK